MNLIIVRHLFIVITISYAFVLLLFPKRITHSRNSMKHASIITLKINVVRFIEYSTHLIRLYHVRIIEHLIMRDNKRAYNFDWKQMFPTRVNLYTMFKRCLDFAVQLWP